MLPDHIQQLLTVAVDGELTLVQRRVVRRLLRRSPESRQFFRSLRADAEALRRLPQVASPVDFSTRIVLAITAQNAPARPTATLAPSAPRRGWLDRRWLFAAAGLFLAVCLGSYTVFAPPSDSVDATASGGDASHSMAAAVHPTRDQSEDADPDAGGTEELNFPSEPGAPARALPTPKKVIRPKNPTSPKPAPTVAASPPKPSSDLASPDQPPISAAQVNLPRLPVIFPVRELDQPAVRQKLIDDFHRDEATHLILFGHEGAKAFDTVRAAFLAQGVKFLVDPVTQERLNRKITTDLVIYVDALSAEDLAKVLQRLTVERPFEKLGVGPVLPEDVKELTACLGVNPISTGGKPKAPLGVDIRKPVSDGTTNQVIESLTAGRPEPVKLAKPERLAVVTCLLSVKVPLASKEIHQLIEARKTLPANTHPVYLTFRVFDR